MSKPSSRLRRAPFNRATSNPSTPLLTDTYPATLTRSTPRTWCIVYFAPGSVSASGYFRHHAASVAARKSAHGASWKAFPMTPSGIPAALTRSASSAEADGPGASNAQVVIHSALSHDSALSCRLFGNKRVSCLWPDISEEVGPEFTPSQPKFALCSNHIAHHRFPSLVFLVSALSIGGAY